ncbi:MAG: DNA polymerase sliding clamp [Desulfurococcales archaeon]|nr:DNA polymerase sliding clamp [Desulfurococcales archaeon]
MVTLLESELENVVARFQFPDAKSFREIVDTLAKLMEEARFTITSDGIKVVGMDSSKMALIDIFMPRDAFLEYEVAEDREEVYLGVNLSSLSQMLKKGKKGEPITFMVADDRALIRIDSVVVKKFLVPNIEVLIEVPEEIRLEFDVEASVISDSLKKALRDVEIVGEVVEFEATEDSLIIKSRGEGAKARTIFTRDSPALTYLEVRAPSKSAYELAYLKNILNLTKIADSVDIRFSTDKPLELVFKTPGPGELTVRYLLAPTSL